MFKITVRNQNKIEEGWRIFQSKEEAKSWFESFMKKEGFVFEIKEVNEKILLKEGIRVVGGQVIVNQQEANKFIN